jgi:hypothetical protein
MQSSVFGDDIGEGAQNERNGIGINENDLMDY